VRQEKLAEKHSLAICILRCYSTTAYRIWNCRIKVIGKQKVKQYLQVIKTQCGGGGGGESEEREGERREERRGERKQRGDTFMAVIFTSWPSLVTA
jgi:hypothetical protein